MALTNLAPWAIHHLPDNPAQNEMHAFGLGGYQHHSANQDAIRRIQKEYDMLAGQLVQAAQAMPTPAIGGNKTSHFEVVSVENGFILKTRVPGGDWKQYIATTPEELSQLFITAMVAGKLDAA